MADRPENPAAADGRGRSIGGLRVLLVAVAIVGIVLGLAVGTSFLPTGAQSIVFRTPLLIVVLIGGTVIVLLRLVRRPPED
jgi:uncharacterized membrane-anchored protein